MMANPEEFRFFLPSVNGEDTAEATEHEGVMTEEEYSRYCGNVQNTGEWGGEPEVSLASSRLPRIGCEIFTDSPRYKRSHEHSRFLST